ncbi:MAG: hypothetical protein M3I19_01095 [Lancefieldella parvula]|uniref:Uncharacterized protein n=1 Tax=Lancefieldella parvula TaxID=1382 RepID=A0A9E7DBM7_9ACTN|nr:MAG: hypothetical protein M3I19_01095 [Lancefieldella parvula]
MVFFDPDALFAHVTSTSQHPSAHACARYQHVAAPTLTPVRTKKPGSGTLPGF